MSDSELTHASEDRQKRLNAKKRAKRKSESKSKLHTPSVDDHHGTSPQKLTTFNTPLLDKNGLVKVALRESMTSGSFINTKFHAFSRRRATGIVDLPLPIFANSELLQVGSKYFSGSYFDGGFHEDKLQSLRGGFPRDKAAYTECYDYDSDSDLEDEVEGVDDQEKSVHGVADKMAQSNITDLEFKMHVSEPESTSDVENHGHVILVTDVAYQTWRALVYYIYTGDTNFARLKSQPEATTPNILSSAPACSPKSMYRLSDKCGIASLKQLARTDIKGKLTESNIVDELCSSLTSMHAEIRDMQVDFACSSGCRSTVLGRIPSWIHNIVDGSLGHTADTLAALVLKLSQRSFPPPVLAPAAPAVDLAKVTQCSHCSYTRLDTKQPIFRFCTYCNTYRNPKAPGTTSNSTPGPPGSRPLAIFGVSGLS